MLYSLKPNADANQKVVCFINSCPTVRRRSSDYRDKSGIFPSSEATPGNSKVVRLNSWTLLQRRSTSSSPPSDGWNTRLDSRFFTSHLSLRHATGASNELLRSAIIETAGHTRFGLKGACRGIIRTGAAAGTLGRGFHLLLSVLMHCACVRGKVSVEGLLVGCW